MLLTAPNGSAIFEFEHPDLRFQVSLASIGPLKAPPPLLAVLMEIITAEWNSRFPWMSV